MGERRETRAVVVVERQLVGHTRSVHVVGSAPVAVQLFCTASADEMRYWSTLGGYPVRCAVCVRVCKWGARQQATGASDRLCAVDPLASLVASASISKRQYIKGHVLHS